MSLNKPNYNMLGQDIHDLIDGHTAQLADIVTVKFTSTTTIQNLINASNGKTLFFTGGSFSVSNLTFPDNSHVIFDNTIFARSGGSSSFLTFGQNCVIEGRVEINGNKGSLTGAKGDIGLYLNNGCKVFGLVNVHDCWGHGIFVGDDCHLYSPIANNNGMTPGPNGTGDGIYVQNGDRVRLLNPYTTGNARNGISVTTYNSSSGLTDITLSNDVIILNPHTTGNSYIDLDVEVVSKCTVEKLRGYGSVISTGSSDCIYKDLEVKSFYANNHDNCSVKDVKINPSGSVTNVFFLSGKNPNVDNVYIHDTATSYSSNTFEVDDSTNKRAVVRNVTVEKGYNGIVVTEPVFMDNCECITATNHAMILVRDSNNTYPLKQRSVRVDNGLMKATNGFMPNTGNGYTGYYRVGDIVDNDTPSETGTTGSKYVVSGWACTVAGTTPTWVAKRCLTGN